MENVIERLPIEFKGKGDVSNYYYTQVYRKKCSDGKYAYIYEQTENVGDGYYTVGYEVVKPKIANKVKVKMIEGRKVIETTQELKETYPKSEQFGINAFSCKTLECAMKKISVFPCFL